MASVISTKKGHQQKEKMYEPTALSSLYLTQKGGGLAQSVSEAPQ